MFDTNCDIAERCMFRGPDMDGLLSLCTIIISNDQLSKNARSVAGEREDFVRFSFFARCTLHVARSTFHVSSGADGASHSIHTQYEASMASFTRKKFAVSIYVYTDITEGMYIANMGWGVSLSKSLRPGQPCYMPPDKRNNLCRIPAHPHPYHTVSE